MRNLLLPLIDRWRLRGPAIVAIFGFDGDETCGAFLVRTSMAKLKVIASNNMGWDHVSVSTELRTPRWAEMSFVHRVFFNEGEVAMQLHVPTKDHINDHQTTLHLWRPHDAEIPLPPKEYV